MIQIQHGQATDPIFLRRGGDVFYVIVLVILSEARPGQFPGWLIGFFRCFILLPSGERSSPLWASADVQVFSVVFTLVPAVHQSWLIILAAHPSAHSGARMLDPCVSSG